MEGYGYYILVEKTTKHFIYHLVPFPNATCIEQLSVSIMIPQEGQLTERCIDWCSKFPTIVLGYQGMQ